MSMLRTLTAQAMNPKTPPSTPFLEKGPNSNSKRTKPVYGAGHRHSTQGSSTFYTRFLHAVILLLLCSLTALYRLHAHPHNAFPLPWSTTITSRKYTDSADYNRDITAQLRTCPLTLEPEEILCIETTNGVLAPADPAHLAQAYGSLSSLSPVLAEEEGGKRAWIDMERGLEGLWGRLVESRCKCENAEALDRTYEGLRERARWMGREGGGEGAVGGTGGM